MPAVGNEAKLILKLAEARVGGNRMAYQKRIEDIGGGLATQAHRLEGYDRAVMDYQDSLTVIVAELQANR